MIHELNPFRAESVAWKRMLSTVQMLDKDKFSQILWDFAGHKHDESCVMHTVHDRGGFGETDSAIGDFECDTMQDLAEKWAKYWQQIQEAFGEFGVHVTVDSFSLDEEEIETAAWNIAPKGEYYDMEDKTCKRSCNEYNEDAYDRISGKIHGTITNIKGAETRTRHVGRGKNRHEETFQVETTIGHEAQFDKDQYHLDDGWGFLRQNEKRLVPGTISLRFDFQGQHIRGHRLLTLGIGRDGEWHGNLGIDSEINALAIEPFTANTFNVDPRAVMEKARMLAIEHEVKNGNEDPTTPEDSELVEDGYLQQAQETITNAHEEPEPLVKHEEPTILEIVEPSIEPKTAPEPTIEPVREPDPIVRTVKPRRRSVVANIEEPKPVTKIEFDMPSVELSWHVELPQPAVQKIQGAPKEETKLVHVAYPCRVCERCGYKTREDTDIYCLKCGKRYGWIALDNETHTPEAIRTSAKIKPSLVYVAAFLAFRLGFTVQRHVKPLIERAGQESVRLVNLGIEKLAQVSARDII